MSFFSFGTKADSDLNAEDFKSKLDSSPNAILLDVRTDREFTSGSIEGAINIDYFSSSFRSKIDELPEDKTYFVYCRSGQRSGQAVKYFKSKGYDAYNLDGGIMAWPY